MIRQRLSAAVRSCAVAALAVFIGSRSLAAPVGVSARQQPWQSANGIVRLQRPSAATVGIDDGPLGSLMSPGWRLVWDGSAMGPGQVVVRLVLQVRPGGPGAGGTASEVLQIGRSSNTHVVRRCLTYGLRGGSDRRLSDRVIAGRRYAAWSNGDAGMSQSISATDLRTVVDGICYAVERFRYGENASDGDPRISLSQAQGAAQLDAALASLRVGR